MPLRSGRQGWSDALAGAWPSRALAAPGLPSLAGAFEREWDERRPFLWLPVAAIGGVLLYLVADREPVLWLPLLLGFVAAVAAWMVRGHPLGSALSLGALALVVGFVSAELRTRAVATPMLDRVRIVRIAGRVDEVDLRPSGARFVLTVTDPGDLAPAPRRVRLTARRVDDLAAGASVSLTARLLPPSGAVLPGGYDFARDAYFSGIGAVGSVLGRVRAAPEPASGGWRARILAAIDRARNDLAARVDAVVGDDDTGAIAAAMVTGKRDLLSAGGREIIREAGIFHIITIAGVQMTLVAGLIFGLVRRALALSATLALTRPIKAWAAAVAILGAVAYDIGTGSRVGTQRALFMTLVMLGAVIAGRRALTMRNLAFAALAVVAIEPEQVAGASFQLSFAAVAALIAVQEARLRRLPDDPLAEPAPRQAPVPPWRHRLRHAGSKVLHLLTATVFATAATAPFMAAEFHELSPYVFIGNPLTLAMIEFFAVPGALLGTALYPLGLDAPVWHWVGFGIRTVMAVARILADAPHATVHLRAFAPWALPCFALAFLNLVIWRTGMLRLVALPLFGLGLVGAMAGAAPDAIVAPTGAAVAIRAPDGQLGTLGKPGGFTAEQWLRADGDPRDADDPKGAKLALPAARCDKLACVAPLPGGGFLSLVIDPAAFAEDCRRAAVIVTALAAPRVCPAATVIDRISLATSGALALKRNGDGWAVDKARPVGEDRPWSPAPKPPPVARGRTRPGEAAPAAGLTAPAPDAAPEAEPRPAE